MREDEDEISYPLKIAVKTKDGFTAHLVFRTKQEHDEFKREFRNWGRSMSERMNRVKSQNEKIRGLAQISLYLQRGVGSILLRLDRIESALKNNGLLEPDPPQILSEDRYLEEVRRAKSE